MSRDSSSYRVAVYGTLKRGGSNHHLIRGARYLGRDVLRDIRLYDFGPYPGAVPGRSFGIEVEVFELDGDQLALVDRLEDVDHNRPEQGLYDRRRYPTRFGEAWVYLYQGRTLGGQLIQRGRWSERGSA
ncbi:MAG: gamma-glutamylcyclotransferase family protein [Marinobacter sp.]|uniref:gamma-glutamylcyclotransferase family protein n=1 Tax=Marinobacter sp. TaxID=50741 RepID=UPI00299D15D3|nr:gamma-glutamylcyclotransferase family protein [Marinobacter sp.]MDX1635070.1 gamma-glutamylcyclotransferase family protein [Marinobacter sp.]